MKEKLWGGRFKEKLDSMILEFTKSIDYDFFLFEYQAQACLAWAKELTRLKIITSQEFQKTKKAIKQLLSEWDKENIKIDFEYEDIHSFFYGLLRNKIGDTVDNFYIPFIKTQPDFTAHFLLGIVNKLLQSFP